MTNAELQAIIDEYIEAERALLKGKSKTINGRSVTRENLQEIRAGRIEWEQKLARQQARQAGVNSLYSVADFS